uniref:TIR domain-containing protein n=1 Tax=Cucumis melo TaxID=3656 RepID=A0A9I9CFP8_CUCME
MNPPSTSPTSSSPPNTCQVFISFATADSKFVSELAKEFRNIRLRTFMSSGDDGEIIHEDAMKKSRHFVVVLTKDYVNSIKCLRELSRIMEYKDEGYEEVIPVFYQDPSCLVKELQDFGKRLEDYEEIIKEEGLIEFTHCWFLKTDLAKRLNKSFSEKEENKSNLLMEVPRWKFALERINNLPKSIFVGEESLESDVIKEVTEIIYKVKASPKLVGISPPLHQMDNLLNLGSNDIRFIGIVGLGGIGKTTIAKVLYEKLEHKFRYCCFLRDFDQKLVSIQKKLLLRLCGKFDIVIKNEDHGAKLIKKCLRNKKVLIVLDGVDERRQIEKLVGSSQDWFSPGSRIIITTRNRNLCCQPKYKHKMLEYNVEFLDHHNAFSLFCNHAFGENHEPLDENFRYLAEEMVKMVEGHPLALIKIGSHLHGKDIDKWEESLEKVHKLLYKYLFCEVFRTSYEELDDESQQVFLDLACFFNNGMSMDRAIEILESFGYRSPYNKLNLLTQRNLIQVSHGMVQMHTLVHCMGRGIVQGERETQSRIWLRKHIRHMFGKEKGLEDVEGIVVMDMEEEELVLDAKSFAYMNKLKLLEINNVRVDEDIQFLSNKLGILRWNGYPSKYLPSTFQPQSLLELHLPNSKVVRLWEGRKGKNLRNQAPDAIICLRSLETLNCERLSRNIWWSLSNLVGSTNGLLPIRDLNLSDCNLVDEDIPDDIKCLYLLEILDLSKNSFVRLKQSLTQLTNLKALYLNDCFNIQPQLLPKLPTSLQYVGGQNSKVLMKAN